MLLVNPYAREAVRVVLTEAQVRGRAHEEYPNHEVGVLIPEMGHQSERLTYVKFFRPFIGRNAGGQSQKKTDNQNGMMVPEWILTPYFPPVVGQAH